MATSMQTVAWNAAQTNELAWWMWFFTDHLSMFDTRPEMVAYRYCEGRYMLLKVGIPKEPHKGIQLRGDVLDLGCGAISIFEKRPDVKVLAIDPLMDAMAESSLLAPFVRWGLSGSCDYHSWTIQNVLDQKFDIVWCYNVLDHVADWKATLNHCWRVLRPGGELLLGTDVREVPQQSKKDRRYHISVFSHNELMMYVREYLGFKLEWVTPERKQSLYRVGLRGRKI